jgi:ribonuclease BN (tRNA processing enzyme)
MKLTIVGCAPAFTTRRHDWPSSCYLLEEGDNAVAIEMGQGSFAALNRYRRPESLSAVLISHLHADHLVDLVPLRHYLRFELDGRALRLHAPGALADRMDAFQAERGFLSPLELTALQPGPVEIDGFTVEAAHVTHIEDSYAFRLANSSRGLVYSGDCGKADDLLALLRPGDTLLCEAAYGTDQEAGGGSHLTARQAAGAAARGQAGRLILTHVLDDHLDDDLKAAAAEVFDGELLVASPGLAIEL